MGKINENQTKQEKGISSKLIPDYYNNVNFDLLKLMPPNMETVVEIGCGAGALAKEYRLLNPDIKYVGIELSDAAAFAINSGRLDNIILGYVEDVNLEELDLKEGGVDCIIYGDVLEHMIDPWKVLTEHSKFISNKGIILACIPNIAHWSII